MSCVISRRQIFFSFAPPGVVCTEIISQAMKKEMTQGNFKEDWQKPMTTTY
jgi:hypothetical protein